MNKKSFSIEVEALYFKEDITVLEALSYTAGKYGIDHFDILKFVSKRLESMLHTECTRNRSIRAESGKGKWRKPAVLKKNMADFNARR